MRKLFYSGIALLSLYSLSSCKQKQENNDIIVEKIVEKPQNSSITSPSKESSGSIKWVNGDDYTYSIHISADNELPEVTIGGETYKDNSAKLSVKRSDGTEFFAGTFTKNSFSGLLTNDIRQNGALVGFAFDHADESHLYFVASIGSPDESSEQFALVQLIVDRMGTTSVAAYTPDDIPNE